MAYIDEGGHAFPMQGFTDAPGEPQRAYHPEPGMTLRDYFAAKAMQALVAKMAFDQPTEDMLKNNGIAPNDFEKFTAMLAYSMADHMIAARKCGPAEGANQPWGGFPRK